MLIEIIFLYFIQRKNLLKTTLTIFLSQGIIMAIANFAYDVLYQIHRYSTFLKFWSDEYLIGVFFSFVFMLLLLIAILILINYFIYKEDFKKNFTKQLIIVISGALINSIVLLLIMIKFPKPFQF